MIQQEKQYQPENAVKENLGVQPNEIKDYMIWNERKQEFEIRRGVKYSNLRKHILENESFKLKFKQCFQFLSDDGGQPSNEYIKSHFHGEFTRKFYPGRYAVKDDIYSQVNLHLEYSLLKESLCTGLSFEVCSYLLLGSWCWLRRIFNWL